MTLAVEVFGAEEYRDRVAERIAQDIPTAGSVVLTGGTTAEKIYPRLAERGLPWGGLDVYFSDERCVPPHDPASNFGMASRLLLEPSRTRRVHRMRGEDPPTDAADGYHRELVSAVRHGFDLVLLGMGADCHVAAMFPGSFALEAHDRLCMAVDRPDGLEGLTLTPPALLAGAKVLILVAGESKAAAVRRAAASNEPPESCPARLLAEHAGATLLLDEAAASLL
jgi:6-phosphogluconolactonase